MLSIIFSSECSSCLSHLLALASKIKKNHKIRCFNLLLYKRLVSHVSVS